MNSFFELLFTPWVGLGHRGQIQMPQKSVNNPTKPRAFESDPIFPFESDPIFLIL